jgi:Flp pilus assembly protein TadD
MRPRDHAAARAVAAELETIVAEVPGFASAHLALARLYNTDFAWTEAMSSGDAERGRALTLARAAVASDRAHSHAHTILGWCHLRQHEWGAARRCFDEAARLNPYHAERLMEIAYGLIHLGDLDSGETLLRRCLAITPVTSDGFYFDLGMLALIRGDPLLAVDQFAMIVDPDVWGTIAAALATVQAGFPGGAAAAAGRAAVLSVWPGRRMPPLASLREWVTTRHPFRLPQHLDRYLAGLDSVFG